MSAKYVIYHKGGGYLQEDGNYTNDIKKAWIFNTKEDAEIEIAGCSEKVETVTI